MPNQPPHSSPPRTPSLGDRAQFSRMALATVLILFGAAMTLVKHPWNITPMGAIALFAGAYLVNRPLAVLVPIAALVISDLAKTLFDPHWGYTQSTLLVMVFKYVGFVGIAWCGQLVRRLRDPPTLYAISLAAGALAGAVIFFVVSNFGVWLTPIFGYERSLNGLLQCYAMGLPFFRAMLVGDLIYVPILFGAFALAERTVPALAPTQAAGK
jgi:hypothetical protein